MEYTKSDSYVVHADTGHRMHQSDQPVTTEVSANDMNMVIWSLMEIINEAGLDAVAFDADDPDTYRRLLTGLKGLFAGQDFNPTENYVVKSLQAAVAADEMDVSLFPWLADKTGATDASPAIQAALATGRPIVMRGTFKLLSTITAVGKVTIRGEGCKVLSNVTSFEITDGDFSAISNIDFAPITTPWTLTRNTNTWVNVAGDVVQSLSGHQPSALDADIWAALPLSVQNQSANQTIKPGILFKSSSPSVAHVGVRVTGITGRAVQVRLEGYNHSVVERCDFGGSVRDGIVFIGGEGHPRGEGNVVRHNRVRWASQCGIVYWGQDGIQVYGNRCHDNGESGIKSYQQDGTNSANVISYGCQVWGNRAWNNYYDGLDLQYFYGIASPNVRTAKQLTLNKVSNNRHTGITTNGEGDTVSVNEANTNGSHGISVKGKRSSVTGNTLQENARLPGVHAFQIYDLICQHDGITCALNNVSSASAPYTHNIIHTGANGTQPSSGDEGLNYGNRCSGGAGRIVVSPNIPSSQTGTNIGSDGQRTGGALAVWRQQGGGVDIGGVSGAGYLRLRGDASAAATLDFTPVDADPAASPFYKGRFTYNFSTDLMTFGTAGTIRLILGAGGQLYPASDNNLPLGVPANRWSVVYAGTGTINTSDEREKQDIGDIPDDWLDAWADVRWVRFKYRDAVAEKADGARWHVGVVAQCVKEAFESRGLDAFELGLLCWDQWPAVEAIPEVLGQDGEVIQPAQPGREAGERYGVRYEEALALEAALVRRQLAEIAGSN
jgi:Chaperone of endosialidase/Right handed beta helix region